MKNIYHKHQTSNGVNYSYWDEDYYLCDTEEEYANERKRYEERLASCKEDYKKRGVENYTPELSGEHAIKAREYYYAHEWTGKNFDAVGFSWTERDSIGSRTEHILKPGSISNQSNADNSGCVGWMYGS